MVATHSVLMFTSQSTLMFTTLFPDVYCTLHPNHTRHDLTQNVECPGILSGRVQGYLAHKKSTPLGPYRRPMPRVMGESQGGGRFLMVEIPLNSS